MSDDLIVFGEAWVNGAKTEEEKALRVAQLDEARKVAEEKPESRHLTVIDGGLAEFISEDEKFSSVFRPWMEIQRKIEEVENAQLAPRCIVQNYLYADVAQLAAAGGTGKTTLVLFEAIHIALGRSLYGLEVRSPGKVLIVTAEDQAERLDARIRELCYANGIEREEMEKALENIGIVDVSGKDVKLAFLDRGGNLLVSGIAGRIVDQYRGEDLQLVVFDPLTSFGAAETRFNDNENALIQAARRIVSGLDCCVRLIHHVSKQNAKDNEAHGHMGRGGSALGDGCRMVSGLLVWNGCGDDEVPSNFYPHPERQILQLKRVKGSYAPPNMPTIWLQRIGYEFTYGMSTQKRKVSPEQQLKENDEQVLAWIRHKFTRPDPAYDLLRSLRHIEDQHQDIGLTRAAVRISLPRLKADAKIGVMDLPPGVKFGAGCKREFIAPLRF